MSLSCGLCKRDCSPEAALLQVEEKGEHEFRLCAHTLVHHSCVRARVAEKGKGVCCEECGKEMEVQLQQHNYSLCLLVTALSLLVSLCTCLLYSGRLRVPSWINEKSSIVVNLLYFVEFLAYVSNAGRNSPCWEQKRGRTRLLRWLQTLSWALHASYLLQLVLMFCHCQKQALPVDPLLVWSLCLYLAIDAALVLAYYLCCAPHCFPGCKRNTNLCLTRLSTSSWCFEVVYKKSDEAKCV